jgi:HPt (histidine-containing phosphotransfer) domain-containing protein
LTATEILRATGYGGPIVAFTANVMSEDVERYLAKGCTHCVGKPIDLAVFTRLLAELLGEKSSPPEVLASAVTAFDLPEFQALKAVYEASFYERLMALNACVASGDWAEAERLAHILKGSGGTYGYPDVSQIAHRIEQHSRAGEAKEAVIAMEQLLALDALQKFLSVGATR